MTSLRLFPLMFVVTSKSCSAAMMTLILQSAPVSSHSGRDPRGNPVRKRWTFLELQSNGSYADDAQAYAAGAVEAYLTHDLMEKQYKNMYSRYCNNQPEYCERLSKFLLENLKYSNSQEHLYESTDPYWHMVHLQMKQLAGLSDHFENKTLNVSNEYLNVTRALFFNVEGDLIDLEGVLRRVHDENSIDQTPACSALIKVVADNDDILFAHDTWFVYRSMLRIEKKYMFPWHFTSKSKNDPLDPDLMATAAERILEWLSRTDSVIEPHADDDSFDTYDGEEENHTNTKEHTTDKEKRR
ncbi:putative secreted protein [Ixodes scapularis]